MLLNIQILPLLAPGESQDVTVYLMPVTELAVTGDVIVESNDPLQPQVAIPVETDIRALAVASRLLAGRPQIPLGEAATLTAPFMPAS